MLFKICTSIENWLDADAHNIACLHCLTGKGRTATIMSCFLTWVGEASSVMEALQMVADKRNEQMEQLTIPSQRRYLQYFSNMLDGVKPRSDPLLLVSHAHAYVNAAPPHAYFSYIASYYYEFGAQVRHSIRRGARSFACSLCAGGTACPRRPPRSWLLSVHPTLQGWQAALHYCVAKWQQLIHHWTSQSN